MLDTPQRSLSDLYAAMAPYGLKPLWEILAKLVPAEPAPETVAHRWAYAPMRAFLAEAGSLISAEKAERRVLILENPGHEGRSATTGSLYAGLQLVLPGEIAPCHRHAPSALRFVMEGQGAHTSVNGEKVPMAPFDLVLTPSGLWHDHGNPTDEPIVWLDGLDIPLLLALECGWAERYPEAVFPATRPAGDTLARSGRGLRPWRAQPHDRDLGDQPLFHYPYADWSASLDAIEAADDPHPAFGHKLEFVNPKTGGPIMKTISAFAQRIPSGYGTSDMRSSAGTIMVLCEGMGSAFIGGERFDLAPRDVFVVPSWQDLRFEAAEAMTLFGFSDRATQEALGLYRETN